jgi:hypothetical protein
VQLAVGTDDKKSIRNYLADFAARCQLVNEILGTTASQLSAPVCLLVHGYAEEHIVRTLACLRFVITAFDLSALLGPCPLD